MFAKWTPIVCGCLMLCIATAARAYQTQNHVLQAVPTPGEVTLDGQLNDWNTAGAIVLADATDKPGRMVRVSAMYDDKGLYLAFEFKDPTPMLNANDPRIKPGRGWIGDSVQLRINCGPFREKLPPVNDLIHHVDCYWSTKLNAPQAYVTTGDLGRDGSNRTTIDDAMGKGVDAAFRMDADKQGYVQEMFIAWSLLRPDKPYQAGDELHMAIEAMWDVGDGEDSDRISDLVAPGVEDFSSIWTRPDDWGTVVLVADSASVTPSDTGRRWAEWLKTYKPAPPPSKDLARRRPCLRDSDPVARALNRWYADGEAAGNVGDYYDNRDRGHSSIRVSDYPQLETTEYSKQQLDQRIDWGLALGVWPFPTVGNSSTASSATAGGCNPRMAYNNPQPLQIQRFQYLQNNIYIYPEHRDYDPGHNGPLGYGDLLPLNTPYLLISQGSSGSDRVFINAVIRTMAAFKPEVKKVLVEKGLLMPTIQAIFRASNEQVVRPDDYFTGAAHPVVFQGDQINERKMVDAAHAMTLDTIPPMAQLSVVAESWPLPGVDAPAGMPSEKICDLPEVIGRVHRRWARDMTFKLSAADSFDWQGKPLTYRWVLLQGDPERVTITPSADGREAEVRVAWHPRFDVAPNPRTPGMQTNRVDIGLFASNGASWSPPAFLCVVHPDNELRTYRDGRLVDCFYAAGDATIGYDTDALLHARKRADYEIRDWSKLVDAMVKNPDSPAAILVGKDVSEYQRKLIVKAVETMQKDAAAFTAAAEAAAPPAKEGEKPEPFVLELKDSQKLSEPMLVPQPSLDKLSVKAWLEKQLNDRISDPTWCLREQAALDRDVASCDAGVQKKIAQARQRLVDLGIYRALPDGGYELHSVAPGDAPAAERLTAYERLEIQRYQLLFVTDVLLPGVVNTRYRTNHVDSAIAKSRPVWDIFEYRTSPDGGALETIVTSRDTDHPAAGQ